MRRSTAFIALALGATVIGVPAASAGPQTICLTDSEPVWYQGLYDTTGAGPQPGTSGPGGGVGWVHYYGWSAEG